MTRRFEWWNEGCHLVSDAAKGPDVTLLIVLEVVDLLGAHIVGSANMGLGKNGLLVHHARQTEVS